MAQNQFVNLTGKVPNGGTTGQVLTKNSDNDQDTTWSPGGGGSGISQLTGDVVAGPGFGSQVSQVLLVGGSSAANVHSAELAANAATNANTASTIVKRDASGNFAAGTITASLTGHASLDVPLTRTISTTAPLTGGGALSSNLTLAIPQADTSTNGFLSSTDFTAFQNKLDPVPQNRTGYVDLVNGNDATGVIGQFGKPFQTLAAAEAAISTASSTNQFQLILSPGAYDVQGYIKQPNIHWVGSGNTWLNNNIFNIFTGDSSAFDLANALVATQDNVTMFKSLTFACPISADFYGVDSVSNNHYGLVFSDVTTFSQCTVVGRGADHDTLIAQNMNFDFGFDLTSVNLRGAGISASGNCFFRANNSRGAQLFGTGMIILSPITVQSVAGSFCIVGLIGSIGGGAITVDGASAFLIMDASFVQSSLTTINGGNIQYATSAKYIADRPTLTTTADHTIDNQTQQVILADTSGAPFTETLPAPTDGRDIIIKDKLGTFATNNLTVDPGAATIDGVAGPQVLSTNFQVFNVVSDGTNWYKL